MNVAKARCVEVDCKRKISMLGCRDSEVRIQHALKLANVDLGCLNVMASPSLFLHFFRQLIFPCSYLIRGTIPTSVLVLVKNIFTPLFLTFLWCASCTHAVD